MNIQTARTDNNLIKILRYDIIIGFKGNSPKYLLVVIFTLISCFMMKNEIETVFQGKSYETLRASVTDYLIYFSKGIPVYIPSPDSSFNIPVMWLLFHATVGLFIMDYPLKDISESRFIPLMQAGKRITWWISKCIWNIATVISIYLLTFITIFFFVALFGKVSFSPTAEICDLISEMYVDHAETKVLLAFVLFIPLCTSIAAALLQMLLSFILSRVYAFLIVMCVAVASAYFYAPFLFFNFSMMLRNTVVYPLGFKNSTAIIIDLIVAFLSIISGYCYFKRLDILKKR